MKTFKYLAAAALTLLAVGCNKESVTEVPDGQTVDVTFTAALPGEMATKAIGDGMTATNLYVSVYENDAEKTKLPLDQTATFTDLKTTVKFSLVKGKTYNFVFWAQAKEGAPYDITDLKNIKVSYDGAVANDENRDAFYATRKELKVNGALTETIRLYRPFAQVNFGTADYREAVAAGLKPTKSVFTATAVATEFDTFEAEGKVEKDVKFTEAALPGETLVTKEGDYTWMTMNYIIPAGKQGEKHISNVTAEFIADAGESVKVSAPQAPVQNNYRTNILGNLLTSQVIFNVEIVPIFEEPDNDIDLVNIKNVESLKALLATGGSATLSEDLVLDETISVAEGAEVTLDLNGKTISNTEDLWDNPNKEAANWSLLSVKGGSLTIKGAGVLKAKENDCYAVDVQDGGHVIIEDGEYVGNIHAVYVLEGTAEIRGGHYGVQQKYPDAAKADEFVLNCYDKNRADGTAKIIVSGGEFEKFNPGDCMAEGPHTNFLAPGYKTVQKGDNYKVVPSNQYTIASQQEFYDAVSAINTSTDTDIKLVLDTDVEWETGDAGDGANVIFTNPAAVVDIDLNGHSMTATGMGGFKSSAKINFHDGTIVDATSYTSESGETAWEFTYLEFEGADMSFENVIFNNTVMFCANNVTAEKCVFKGIATLESNNPNEYALWVATSAQIKGCKFEDLYRGIKICKYYYHGAAEAFSVSIDGCSFKNISKKAGVVIDAKGERTDAEGLAFKTISISNSTFENVKGGEAYETDNLVPVVSNNEVK